MAITKVSQDNVTVLAAATRVQSVFTVHTLADWIAEDLRARQDVLMARRFNEAGDERTALELDRRQGIRAMTCLHAAVAQVEVNRLRAIVDGKLAYYPRPVLEAVFAYVCERIALAIETGTCAGIVVDENLDHKEQATALVREYWRRANLRSKGEIARG